MGIGITKIGYLEIKQKSVAACIRDPAVVHILGQMAVCTRVREVECTLALEVAYTPGPEVVFILVRVAASTLGQGAVCTPVQGADCITVPVVACIQDSVTHHIEATYHLGLYFLIILKDME